MAHDQTRRIMKMTHYFPSSKPFTDKEERPISTSAINNRELSHSGKSGPRTIQTPKKSMSQSGKSGPRTIQTPKKSMSQSGKSGPRTIRTPKKSMSQSGKSGPRTIRTPRTKNKKRFTEPEVNKLVATILAYTEQLVGPNRLNASGKAAIWDKVKKEVNKVGGMRRKTLECKRKWGDYRRKVKQDVKDLNMQSSTGGPMPPLKDKLSPREMMAKFNELDASDRRKIKIPDKSSADTGECASSNENTLTTHIIVSSDEESIPSQNKSVESSTCLPSTSYQDELISQSYEEPQAASDRHNPMAVGRSTLPHTATESQLQPETQMDQLVAQQKNIIEVLQSMQKNLTESQNIQNKMYNLLKQSFLKLQKTLQSQQKDSGDHSTN